MPDSRTIADRVADACWALLLSGITIGFVAGLMLAQALGAFSTEVPR